MIYCRKCKRNIPYRIRVGNKIRSLRNRKFCLICSPFGSRNNKPDDPNRQSRNRHNLPYREWILAERQYISKAKHNRAVRLKKEIVFLSGGKCLKCGYDKNLKLLCFHHRKPSGKIFGLNASQLMKHSRTKILKEIRKCDLLCRSCHEKHHKRKK